MNMSVHVEVWPIAADHIRLWLVSGDHALRTPHPLDSADDVHFTAENLLHKTGSLPRTTMLHSTSWRPDGPSIVLTYMAVLTTNNIVLADWPQAKPISRNLADAVGKPTLHDATDVPIPRDIDVLLHGIRHIKFLLDTDSQSKAGIPPSMQKHLHKLQPTLAGMYQASSSPPPHEKPPNEHHEDATAHLA